MPPFRLVATRTLSAAPAVPIIHVYDHVITVMKITIVAFYCPVPVSSLIPMHPRPCGMRLLPEMNAAL